VPRTVPAAHRRAAALPPEQRRAAIIEAVQPLLVEHGEMVTTRQIAEAAGVAEGTIFRVFADKDELIAAALDAALDMTATERAIAAIDRDQPLDRQLVIAVEIIQRRVVDVWGLVSNVRPQLQGTAARPLTDLDALTALFEPVADRLTMPPAAAARLLRGLTLSMTHPMISGELASAPDIVSVFLHGIERRP
jgi:AcrR family transcriptional regulator